MVKFRIFAAVILVAAVLAVGVVPLTAEAAPVPMLCFITVCNNGAVGVGHNVSAHIEGTTGSLVRAEGLTDANGNVTLQIWPTDPELLAHQAVTFKVDGLPWWTTPEVVTVTLAPQTIILYWGHCVPCITWDFPHGLDVDRLAVFGRYYDCSRVTLGSLNVGPLSTPAELEIVWHYKEALPPEWQYFIPGGEGSLTTLVAGNVYLMVVESACTWYLWHGLLKW